MPYEIVVLEDQIHLKADCPTVCLQFHYMKIHAVVGTLFFPENQASMAEWLRALPLDQLRLIPL